MPFRGPQEGHNFPGKYDSVEGLIGQSEEQLIGMGTRENQQIAALSDIE